MDEPRRVLDSQGTIWIAIQECHQVLLRAFDGTGRQVRLTSKRLDALSDRELRELVDGEDARRADETGRSEKGRS